MKKFGLVVLTAVGSVAAYEYARKQGWIDQLSGEVKRSVGKVTEDPSLQIKGFFQSKRGEVKEAVSDVKEAVEDVVEDIQE